MLCPFITPRTSAHPGSGIVVDQQGQVFFTGMSCGLWKIDAQGRLTSLHSGGGHWLALDADGGLARADFPKWFEQRVAPNFERIPLPGSRAALIQTDGCPFVVHHDGHVDFARGNVEIARVSLDGRQSLLVPNFKEDRKSV